MSPIATGPQLYDVAATERFEVVPVRLEPGQEHTYSLRIANDQDCTVLVAAVQFVVYREQEEDPDG